MPIERKALFLKSRPSHNVSCLSLIVAASFFRISSVDDPAAHGESKRGAVPRADGMTTRSKSPQFNPQVQAALSGSCTTPRLCGETAILTGFDTQLFDEFGYSLAISQSVLVVGARLDTASAYHSGSAYVFRRNGLAWVEEEMLSVSEADVQFGSDVAIHGDVIVAGAPQADLPGRQNVGAAYVFRWNGVDWLEEAKLTAPDPSGIGRFGDSVAIDNDLIMVGVPHAGVDVLRASVFFFSYNNGTWVYRQQIKTPADRYTAKFGLTGVLASDVALVGELENDANGVSHGTAYAFRKNGSLFVLEQQFDLGSGCVGWVSVATDGALAVIGARSCTGAQDGKAHIYRFDGLSWNLEATLTPFGVPSDYRFAEDVAVSGNRIVISGVDAAYLYRYEAGTWIEGGKIPSTPYLGVVSDVALQDGTLAVAHYARDSVSLYDVEVDGPDCDCDEISDACEIASHIESDCNANLIPDGCDIESGPSFDCNGNTIPDECDIADETSTDANKNDIPDECDTNLPPFIIDQSVHDIIACEHETVIFSVMTGGMSPFSYQWRKDTVELTGETTDTLTLTNVTRTHFKIAVEL